MFVKLNEKYLVQKKLYGIFFKVLVNYLNEN